MSYSSALAEGKTILLNRLIEVKSNGTINIEQEMSLAHNFAISWPIRSAQSAFIT